MCLMIILQAQFCVWQVCHGNPTALSSFSQIYFNHIVKGNWTYMDQQTPDIHPRIRGQTCVQVPLSTFLFELNIISVTLNP